MDVRVKGGASHALQCIATQFCSNARHEHAAGKREGVQSGAGLVVEAARGASARALARHLLLALRAHASRLPELGLAVVRLLAVALHLGLVLRRKLRRRLLLLLAHALGQEPAAQRSAGAADNTEPGRPGGALHVVLVQDLRLQALALLLRQPEGVRRLLVARSGFDDLLLYSG